MLQFVHALGFRVFRGTNGARGRLSPVPEIAVSLRKVITMRLKLFLLGTALTLASAGAAEAGHFNGWYIGLEGGANWTSDNDALWGTIAPPPTAPVNLDFDTGWTALGTVGYGFAEHWRIEGELGYRHNDADVTGAVNRSGGELGTTSLMANVLYDWNISDRMTLSAGVGAGAVHQQFDDGLIDQDEDYNFAYQGIIGASYALSPRTDLMLNYRYMRSDNADFRDASGPGNFYATDDFENHAVTVGLRFDLNADVQPVAYSPPPPAAEPPPPPAAPAQPRQFLVFFGFDKSNLTDEAQRVVADAAAAAKQYGSASIRVVGHADSAGSTGYNQQLSERRASAVRAGLVAQGIEAGKITASGRGETELLVKTDDGVKEPQNRRSSIDLE